MPELKMAPTSSTDPSGAPDATLRRPALLLCILAVLMGLFYYYSLWQFDENGLSIISGTTPYWDFNNLWLGSKLAFQGQVEILFDLDTYRAEMDRYLGLNVPAQEWSYPPHMLWVGGLLSIMPVFLGYLIWTLGSILILHLVLRKFELAPLVHLAVLFSPAVLINATFGQNGTFISALLLAALAFLPTRPILAGVFIGLLTIKPQFGILLPFILIANRNWIALGSATVTALILFVATGLAFGFETWSSFTTDTQPMMTSIMQAPYRQPYHSNAASIFIAMRGLGAELFIAYGVQILASLACLVGAMAMWRPQSTMRHDLRIALTCFLVFLATPYAYSYDIVSLSVAIGIVYTHGHIKPLFSPVFALFWVFPLINHLVVNNYDFNYGGPLALILLLVIIFRLMKTGPAQPKIREV